MRVLIFIRFSTRQPSLFLLLLPPIGHQNKQSILNSSPY